MADRRVSVSIDADTSKYNRALLGAVAATKAFSREIEQSETRLSGVVQTSMALGPALVPIGAAAVPAMAGLAAQLGAAATAGGVALLAFNGVGDALGALNDYHLEPSAANFAKLQEQLRAIGPSGESMVRFLDSLRPKIDQLQELARSGLFPGVEEGLTHLLDLMPQAEQIISSVAQTLGDLTADAGAALSSDRWIEIFDYLGTELGPKLRDLGESFGYVTEGIANVMVALDPLSDDFSSALVRMAKGFRDWSAELGNSQGLQDFIAYARESGPAVADALTSVGNAMVQLVQAAAPIGSAVLPMIEALADALAAVANSAVGPQLLGIAVAIGTLNRAIALMNAAKLSSLSGALGSLGEKSPKAATGMKALGAALIGLDVGFAVIDHLNRSLDETLPGIETLTSRLYDLTQVPTATLGGEFDSLASSIARVADGRWDDGMEAFFDSFLPGVQKAKSLREAEAEINALDAAMANLVSSGSADLAAKALQNLFLSQDLSAEQQAQLIDLMPQYAEALAAAGLSADLAADDTRGLGGSMDEASSAAQQLQEALARLNRRLEGRANMRDYEAAIDAVTDSLKENGRTLNVHTAAGRANQETLDGIAAASLSVADGMRKSNKVEFLQRARGDFIDAAQKLGKTREGAERLADKLGLLDRTDANPEIDPKGAKKASDEIGGVQKKADKLGAAKIVPDLFVEDKASPKLNDVDAHLGALDQSKATPTVAAQDLASATLNFVRNALSALDGDRADTYVVTHYQNSFDSSGGRPNLSGSADGSTVPGPRYPYADKIPYMLAPGEEVISNRYGQADRNRGLLKAINAGHLADGGTAGGLSLNLDQRLGVANLEQQIRQLRRDLAKTGDEAMHGLEIKVAQLQLKAAQRDLRQARREPIREARQEARDTIAGLRDARGGLDITADMSGKDVRGELRDFFSSIRDAGGKVTKRLDHFGDAAIRNARRIHDSERAIERETRRRDKISDSLDEQQQAMENLRVEMEQFGSSVSSNFLTNPFNGAHTITGGSGPAARPTDPALIAARDQLQAAESRLAGIRGRADIAPLERSYLASRAVAEVANLRDQVEQLDRGSQALGSSAEPVERTVSGLEALRETLTGNISGLDSFIASMSDLRGVLAPGFYSSLAQSGDFGTAAELAALPDEQVAELNALWLERQDKSIELAAITTQQVYGQQQALLQAGLDKTAGLLDRANQRIDHQTAVLERRVGRLENTNKTGLAAVGNQIERLRGQVAAIPRDAEEVRRGGRGRR